MDINRIFEMLNEDNPEEIQNQGIEEAKKIKYLSVLFQPVEDKWAWENCAKVICSKTDEVLEEYLFWLFDWLQDANWPGFFTIYNRMKQMRADAILSMYVYTIRKALKIKDENWLVYLSGFIDNPEILEGLPLEYQKIMKECYHKFWG